MRIAPAAIVILVGLGAVSDAWGQRSARGNTLRSVEEEYFVRKLADQIYHTFAVVAENPDAAYPEASLAARVQATYLAAEPERRRALQLSSRSMVRASPRTARRLTRAPAAPGAAVSPEAGRTLDPEMKMLLRQLLADRVAEARPQLEILAARDGSDGSVQLPKTWVKGGIFGEVDAGAYQKLTLNEPQVLGFHWTTEEPGAVRGYFELRRSATPYLPEAVLARGEVPDNTSKPGIGGFFEIDLRKYLPAQPALGSPEYRVRVLPIPEPSLRAAAGRARPGGLTPQRVTPQAIGSTPKAPDGVGPWSAPVVICYGLAEAPAQSFEEVYHSARFSLDSIYLVEDQQGAGAEEFFVTGFIQSHSPQGAGNQYKLPLFETELDTDDRYRAIDQTARFSLPSDPSDFPRAFTVVLSVLEKDDGEMFSEWLAMMAKVGEEALADEIDRIMREQLEEIRQEMLENTSEKAMEHAWDTILASTSSDFFSAWIKMVATLIIEGIVGGKADDFYGVETITFLLPSNRVDDVLDSEAFLAIVNLGGTQSLAGSVQSDGSARIKSKSIRFYGQASYPQAAAFDGKVDLTMHWVLSGRGL